MRITNFVACMSAQNEYCSDGSLQHLDQLQTKQQCSPEAAPPPKIPRNDSPGTPPLDSKHAIIDRVGLDPRASSHQIIALTLLSLSQLTSSIAGST
jgi:hypothetical protein